MQRLRRVLQKARNHELTVPYTPQQNGVAERMNRTLVEKAKCLLFDAGLPMYYWAEATHMSAYLINKIPSKGKIPDELFYEKRINLCDLKLFGTKVMVHIPKVNRKKWDKKSKEMIFVGYDDNRKGYRCIEPTTRRLHVSRDVIFLEPNQLKYVLCNSILAKTSKRLRKNNQRC